MYSGLYITLLYRLLGSPRQENVFPNLTGSPGLQLVHLDRVWLTSVPSSLCRAAPRLTQLRLRSNRLTSLPDLAACTSLVQLDLGLNRLKTLIAQH